MRTWPSSRDTHTACCRMTKSNGTVQHNKYMQGDNSLNQQTITREEL